ncbi:SEP-domain-containing protein [Coemansia reversa NRRL 1564]|uniref:SEP-domain-containing protein n=1 Tax=Coemansia reversa (strain ATCC 12441 / NRRL 1564) TaxID=763665 RepID=A0A2G5BJ48_COERN|nr:SEP-domain-containing protein [Coemansia reversa NRRL 1564]|eukprot:PIA19019.1 SEP-domain-containing protein [Coemansia reversa NRRL 1564]
MNDPSSQSSLIQKWMEISQGSEEQARFHLEENNWDLKAALNSFYQVPPLSEGLPPPHEGDLGLPPDPNLVASESTTHPSTAVPVASAAAVDTPAATRATAVPYRRSGPSARIATLSSIRSHPTSSGADANSDDDDDEHKWYAGGESSGMAVQPPSADESGSLVDRIMRRAAEGSAAFGATSDDAQQGPPDASSAFAGHGRKLGSPNTSGAVSQNPSVLASAAVDPVSSDDIAIRELTFWRNGFSIGDGPLYNLEDPINRQNLDAILQGRAPLDILNVRPRQRVEMKIADRRGEDYTPSAQPPLPAQPFVGHGRRLGGIGPAVNNSPASSTSAAASQAPAPLTLDPSQPTVQVQIRMADGKRLIARANPSHTIGDLRSFVLSQSPAAAQRPFTFRTISPAAVLSDDSLTVKDAGIVNAAIAQHFL